MDEDGEGLRQGDSRETTTASHTWDYGSRSHGGDEIWREGTDTDLEIRREVDGFTTSVTELMTLANGLEATHKRNGGV